MQGGSTNVAWITSLELLISQSLAKMLIIRPELNVSHSNISKFCRWKFVGLKVGSTHETNFCLPLSKTLNHSINKWLTFFPLWPLCWSIASNKYTVFTWHICSFFDKGLQVNLPRRAYICEPLWRAHGKLNWDCFP